MKKTHILMLAGVAAFLWFGGVRMIKGFLDPKYKDAMRRTEEMSRRRVQKRKGN